LFIAVTLDDEVAHMDAVAQQFQAMLQRFPTQASKTLIMSSAQFAQEHAGAEFHVRRTRRGRRTLALVLSPLALSFLWCAFVDQEPFGAFVLGLLFTVLFGAIALGAWLVRRFGEKRLKETVP